MKQTLFVSVLGILLSTTSVVHAELYGDGLFEDEESSISNLDLGGLYGGASVGYNRANCSFSDETCSNAGWKLYGGYKVTEMLGVEAGYYQLGDYTKDITHKSLGEVKDTQIDATGVSLAGVVNYPVRENIDLFGKLGIMKWEANAEAKTDVLNDTKVTFTDQATDLLLGGGANYKLNENLGLRGEYEYVAGDLSASLFSLGANYATY